MAGDVKIGGGHSSFVYAFVGEAKDKNSRKHTAIFDDSDPATIKVYVCEKGTKTLGDPKQARKIEELDAGDLGNGKFFWIQWD